MLRRLLLLVPIVGVAAVPHPAYAQTATVRVAAYNIRHGRGMDDEVDLDRIADVLRGLDADVIALQEVDDRTRRTGGVDQVEVLAGLLGYEGVHGPHRAFEGGWYGNAVLTRLPIVEDQVHALPPAAGSALSVLEVTVAVPMEELPPGTRGPLVSVISTHLAGTPEERTRQADAITAASTPWRPTILAGDLNGRPEDPAVRALERVWRRLEKSGDARTYPAAEPDREIDFVLWKVNERLFDAFTIEVTEHRVVAEPMASDHRPLLAVFELSR